MRPGRQPGFLGQLALGRDAARPRRRRRGCRPAARAARAPAPPGTGARGVTVPSSWRGTTATAPGWWTMCRSNSPPSGPRNVEPHDAEHLAGDELLLPQLGEAGGHAEIDERRLFVEIEQVGRAAFGARRARRRPARGTAAPGGWAGSSARGAPGCRPRRGDRAAR